MTWVDRTASLVEVNLARVKGKRPAPKLPGHLGQPVSRNH
jgi:hypothetical protein